jgi:hypothetical protein
MAKRYIDAERIDFSPLIDDFDRARAKIIIMGQPTADVVEVVRCKNCKNFCEYSDSYKSEVEGADGDCYIRILNSDNNQFNGVKYDDFCSYGERRTDDGDEQNERFV